METPKVEIQVKSRRILQVEGQDVGERKGTQIVMFPPEEEASE